MAQSRSVFISYRRQDAAAEALNLFDALTAKYGNRAIFMDIDGIPLGVDFREHLKKSLSGCRVLLAVIGRSWLTSQDDNGSLRLNDANDFVRFEIATALTSSIDVIPVLVQGAAMPPATALPEEIKGLSFRHGTKLSHDHWKSDTAQLVSALEPYLRTPNPTVSDPTALAPRPVDAATTKKKFRFNWTLTITLCAFAAVLAVGLGLQTQLGMGTSMPPTPGTGTGGNHGGNPPSPRVSGPVRVLPGTMVGYLMASPAPAFPAGAKPGTVTLHAIISRTGTVGNLSVVSGPDSLQASALDAVRNWRYTPYLVNGVPAEVDTTIAVNIGLVNNGHYKQN